MVSDKILSQVQDMVLLEPRGRGRATGKHPKISFPSFIKMLPFPWAVGVFPVVQVQIGREKDALRCFGSWTIALPVAPLCGRRRCKSGTRLSLGLFGKYPSIPCAQR